MYSTMQLYCFRAIMLFTFGMVTSHRLFSQCNVAKNSGNAAIEGMVNITQSTHGGNVSISVHLTGFASATSLHGFHVHEKGDIENQCKNAGGHYNPAGFGHGAPSDFYRHVGDLGNVEANNGMVHATIVDNLVTLTGPYNVSGLAIVITSNPDDLGLGNSSLSNTTGNSGDPMGCCIISEPVVLGGSRYTTATPSVAVSTMMTALYWSRLVLMMLVAFFILCL